MTGLFFAYRTQMTGGGIQSFAVQIGHTTAFVLSNL